MLSCVFNLTDRGGDCPALRGRGCWWTLCPRSDRRPVSTCRHHRHLFSSRRRAALSQLQSRTWHHQRRKNAHKSLIMPKLCPNFAKTSTRSKMGRFFHQRPQPARLRSLREGIGRSGTMAKALCGCGVVYRAQRDSGTAYDVMPDAILLDVVDGIPGQHTAGHRSIAAPLDNSKHSNSKQDCSELW